MKENESAVRFPTWIIEADLNAAAERLAEAALRTGAEVVRWRGEERALPPAGTAAIFYGSLGDCARFEGRWRPGVLGDGDALRHARWIEVAGDLALNQAFVATTVEQVGRIQVPWDPVFVRPDSAFKPFSGRVVPRDALSPAALDFGFYFDDLKLPIILAPAVPIDAEWRFVVVGGQVVAGCAYQAVGRSGAQGAVPAEARAVAEAAGGRLNQPAVVVDVCRSAGRYALVEYNLFSGADLYDCDVDAVVKAVHEAAGGQ